MGACCGCHPRRGIDGSAGENWVHTTSSFFTKQKLLPQSQTPDQLAAWLSTTHPGYDLVAWCFYGNLISEAEGAGGEHDKIAAVSAITQFQQERCIPQLEGIGIRPFQSAFMYDDAKTDGYILSGVASPFPIPAVTNTQDPWSLVVSYKLQGSQNQSTICLSLLSGRMGSMDATYAMTADVWCTNGQRLRAEIEFVDRMGVVSEGHGPSGFAPQGITSQQAREIEEKYNCSVPDYLDKTEDRMANQGAYSYSAPLLKVHNFKILGHDDEVLNEGTTGYLWMDYMVMSYPTPTRPNTGATWQFFAIQFPTIPAALMVSIVESSQTKLPTAKFFSMNSRPMANGALNAEHEWRMDEIILKPVDSSEWVSPHGVRYCMQYTINLNSPEFEVVLSLKSIRKDQAVYIPMKNSKPVTKYEGVFEVSGTIKGETCHGYAWGELNNN